MQRKLLKVAGITAVLIIAVCMNAVAQDQSPVKIVFDKNAKRIDIMTSQQIPNYTQAQRGSIQFYLGRLDTPENGFYYFFDGRRFQNVDNLSFMRKMPSIGCWIIASSRSGRPGEEPSNAPPTVPTAHPQTNCEVWHHAVSFIPLDSNGRPQPKVYVLLNDIELIQWSPYDNWLATDTQDQIEAKTGTIY